MMSSGPCWVICECGYRPWVSGLGPIRRGRLSVDAMICSVLLLASSMPVTQCKENDQSMQKEFA